jgi:hypothetical protein
MPPLDPLADPKVKVAESVVLLSVYYHWPVAQEVADHLHMVKSEHVQASALLTDSIDMYMPRHRHIRNGSCMI